MSGTHSRSSAPRSKRTLPSDRPAPWTPAGASDAMVVHVVERGRIAGELQDVAGLLSMISVYSGALELDPSRSDQDDEVRLIRQTAATALEQTRAVIDGLGGTDRAAVAVPEAPAQRRRRMARLAVPVIVLLVGAGTLYAAVGARWGAAGGPSGDSRITPVGAASASASSASASSASASSASSVPTPAGTAATEPVTAEAEVSLEVVPVAGEECSFKVRYTGRIRVPRGPVTVRYRWDAGENVITPQETVDFPGTGPQEREVHTDPEWGIYSRREESMGMQILAPVPAAAAAPERTVDC